MHTEAEVEENSILPRQKRKEEVGENEEMKWCSVNGKGNEQIRGEGNLEEKFCCCLCLSLSVQSIPKLYSIWHLLIWLQYRFQKDRFFLEPDVLKPKFATAKTHCHFQFPEDLNQDVLQIALNFLVLCWYIIATNAAFFFILILFNEEQPNYRLVWHDKNFQPKLNKPLQWSSIHASIMGKPVTHDSKLRRFTSLPLEDGIFFTRQEVWVTIKVTQPWPTPCTASSHRDHQSEIITISAHFLL